MNASDTDSRVRLAAFEFLAKETARRGEVVPRGILAEGFQFGGTRVPLVGPQGIFKPAVLPEMPLTITTVPEVRGRPRPYADSMGSDGLLRYAYRGTDPLHRDNVGLRTAMQRRAPLAYLFGVVPGEYMPVWPVYIEGDDPARLEFSVAVDEPGAIVGAQPQVGAVAEARRVYLTVLTRRRLHQQTFRQRVLRAYQERCAVCRLRRRELLDAAHILPDIHPLGEPVVPNGLALCSLHHAAFDRHVLGIRPDLVVELRLDILREIDGPLLVHGLQGFQGRVIEIPREAHLQPNPAWLAERYHTFQRAG
ncbi:MAG TPA: HNH endonuclease [Candidatus Binatia bacterium]|nr:HNH endonuclease [Candidatus Binatia bacterium]